MNVATVFEKSARQFPERVALRCQGQEMTYRELNERATALARFLSENGLGSGDRVAIYLSNRIEYMVCILATWKAGGVVVPVNFALPDDTLRYVLGDSGSTWLIVGKESLGRVESLLSKGSQLMDHLIVIGTETPTSGYSFEKVSGTGADDFLTRPRRDADIAILMYTSGTTGRPKGVLQTHRNNMAAIEMVTDAWQLTQETHILLPMPLFHVGGLQCSTFPTLACGGTITLLPRWRAADWIELTIKLRPTISAMVSAMVIDVLNSAKEDYQFDSLQQCFIGGSSTPEIVAQRFYNRFGVKLKELYGQTENTGLSVTYRYHEERLPGSAGRPMEQVVEARIAHPQTREDIPVGDETIGELCLRGDTITPGYWHRPELLAEKFEDGWLRTGDMFRRDKNGYLYYADRIDDMIVTGGENVYPQDVEGVLAQHEGIAEVAVIGTPHERLVTQVTALIVPKNETVTIADIDEFCKQHTSLAGYQRPRRIVLVEALPKTGSGKIDKPALKQRYS
jgi:long-chain acyl-CoA synthetase